MKPYEAAALVLTLAWGLSSAANAEVITGIVIDSATGSPLKNVEVSLENEPVSTVRTNSSGKFTISTDDKVAVKTAAARNAPEVFWHADNNALSWHGYHGPVAIRILDISGSVRARYSSRNAFKNSEFVLPPLASGMYVAAITAGNSASRIRFLKLRQNGVAQFQTRSRIQPAMSVARAKTAVTELTLSKRDYKPRVVECRVGQASLQIRLRKCEPYLHQHGLLGTKSITVLRINFTDGGNAAATMEKCEAMARYLKNYYNRNARGFCRFEASVASVDVPYATTDNVAAARKMAEGMVDKYDFHVVPLAFKKGSSFPVVGQMTKWVAAHELGHCIGLGEARHYTYDSSGLLLRYTKDSRKHKKGDPIIEGKENQTLMGSRNVPVLAAPEYYYLGWLPDKEVAFYDPKAPTYTLKKIGDAASPGLSTVIVSPKQMGHSDDQRAVFISYSHSGPDVGVLMHYQTASGSHGGSLKIKEIKDEYFDDQLSGIRCTVLSMDKSKARIKIEVDK